MSPTPEHARKWFGVLLPVLREGSAVLSLFMLILGSLVIWWLLGAMKDQQTLTRTLAERLLTCVQERGELLYKYRPPQP